MAAASLSDDLGKFILRLAVGGLLLFHGVGKIFHGVEWMTPVLAHAGLPAILRYGVYVGEVVAPILLLAGAFTRIATLIVAFDMAMAIYLAHAGQVLTLNEITGGWSIELEMLYLLGALVLFFIGPGRFAVTTGRGRKK